MAQSTNMQGAVRFDLGDGKISLKTGESCLLVPTSAMVSLFRELPTEALVDFGHALGNNIARTMELDVADFEALAPAELVERLGSNLALMGLGSLALEQWGQALVFAVTKSPVLLAAGVDARVDPGDLLLAAVLEGTMSRLNMDTRIVAVARAEGTVRLLACNPQAKEKVLSWLGEGRNYGEILANLNDLAGAA